MNILVLNTDLNSGCRFYRVIHPFNHLREITGWNIDIVDSNIIDGNIDEEVIKERDYIYCFRGLSYGLYSLLVKAKSNGVKIIYEIDDLYHDIPKYNISHNFWSDSSLRNVEEFMKIADKVVVTTKSLKNYYLRFNSNIVVIDNYINKDFIPKKKYNKTKIFRIGWAGSTSHDADIDMIVDPVTRFINESNSKLVFVGGDYRRYFIEIPYNKMEFIKGTFKSILQENEDIVKNYYSILASSRIDIGIAPLKDIFFNQCRSSIKLKEYTSLKIPFLASNLPEYNKFCKNIKVGNICLFRNNEDLYRKLKLFYKYPKLLDSISNQINQDIYYNDSRIKLFDF